MLCAMNEGHLFCDSADWRTAVREHMIPWAVGAIDLGDDVLEIGPGYGATTEVFAEMLPRLTSVEIDPDLAARLQARFADTHIEVVLGDATELAFPSGRFSGALCFSMLHHVPSAALQDQIFAEAARVLRPGSPIVALDGVESEAVREFHEGDTYQPIDPATLPARLTNSGFTDVEVRLNEYGWAAVGRRT
jgi:SAM-dependent methyltransferase